MEEEEVEGAEGEVREVEKEGPEGETNSIKAPRE